MKTKTIVTIVILAFVAVAVGYLVVKEVRAARAPGVAAAEPSATETAAVASGGEVPEEGISPSAGDRVVVVTYFYTSKR